MAVNSSKLLKLPSSQNSENKTNFDTGKIDPRILKILGVSEFDIEDEQEYLSLLKEKMLLITMGKSKLSREDEELITEELKRLRSKKFPKKKITADSFKKGTASGINLNIGKKLGAGIKPLALPPAIDKMSGKNDLEQIQDALTAIIKQLTILNGLTKKSSEKGRREKENARRGAREKNLESGFSKALNIAEKVIAPVKSILQRIIDFFLAVFIGRSLILLLEWFNNPANKKKVDTILRFLGDHWPKLLALFVAFGTGLGGFARGIIKLAIWGTGALIKAAAGLAARAGIKGAAGALKFLGGPKGKLLGMGLELAAVAGGTFALSKGIEESGGIGGEKEEQPQTPKAGFSGGGFANFGKMFGGSGFNPTSTPLRSGGEEQKSNGFVSGQSGVDKVPAMLTDGEFVMSTGAVQKYGVDTLEAMNASGGGTNQPKVVGGKTYAAGGGLVGDIPLSTSYGTNPNDNALRQAARMWSQNGKFGAEEDLFKTFKKLGGVADFEKMVGGKQNFQGIQQGMHGTDDSLDAIRRSVIEKLKGVNKPGSVTRSINALHSAEDILTDRIKDNRSQLRQTGSRLRTTRIDPSRMIPAAGQSSANSMRAASGVRPPIPATSAIVPYAGSGLVNTGVTRGLSKPPVQQIRTNMNVPGGRIRGGSLSAIMAAFEMKQRKDEGQTNVQAGLGAGGAALGGQLGWMGGAKAGAIAGAALGSIVPGLGTGVGAAVGAIVGGLAAGYGGAMLGGKLADDFSGVNAAKERASRGVGGNIVGGYGLKAQSFKDAPKTSIITDDKGRPFVGHKAIKNGRLTYVRGSQPGTGTTNPLEMLGRFINPGAYKNNDAKLAGQKHKEAMVNALEGFQKQGMAPDAQARMMKQMGGNLKDTQNHLNFRKKSAQVAKTKPKPTGITPPSKSQTKVTYVPNKNTKRNVRGGGTTSSAKPKAPQFNASSPKASKARSLYGVG